MKRSYYILATLVIGCILILPLAACTQSSQSIQPSGNTGNSVQGQTGIGRIEVHITDAPPENKKITSIILTVSGIEIHATGVDQQTQGDTWIKINSTGSNTFDLMKIKGLDQLFAAGDLQSGKYTQVRLIVTNASVGFSDNTTEVATIPSGEVKFVTPFDIIAGKTTVLTLDFDAEKSVNVTGGDKVMIRPVVKLDVKLKEAKF